jgi:hypothetical protein
VPACVYTYALDTLADANRARAPVEDELLDHTVRGEGVVERVAWPVH